MSVLSKCVFMTFNIVSIPPSLQNLFPLLAVDMYVCMYVCVCVCVCLTIFNWDFVFLLLPSIITPSAPHPWLHMSTLSVCLFSAFTITSIAPIFPAFSLLSSVIVIY